MHFWLQECHHAVQVTGCSELGISCACGNHLLGWQHDVVLSGGRVSFFSGVRKALHHNTCLSCPLHEHVATTCWVCAVGGG